MKNYESYENSYENTVHGNALKTGPTEQKPWVVTGRKQTNSFPDYLNHFI